MRVSELRKNTGLEKLYHLPLMLTLVNSVNTDVENERNDLWAFFQTLREIATGEIDGKIFKDSKNELIADWRNATLLFGEDGGGIIGTDETSIEKMLVADLREAVFISRRKGALQFIRSGDNKELAFQMKNADSPFALIRIGDTSKYRNELLVGYEETTVLQEKSFFDGLEQSPITILMGSRTFFESWDSNRPNVINFINIGSTDAKKFVVQSVGRGVRIEPLPNRRHRFAYLLPHLQKDERTRLEAWHDQIAPPETLFLFATNRGAIKTVLEGLETEKVAIFETLAGFEKAPIPQIDDAAMPLLIPQYRETQALKARFSMSEGTLQRFKGWLERTSDSVLAVRDGLPKPQIDGLRGLLDQATGIQIVPEKDYATLPFLQSRLLSHLAQTERVSDGVRVFDAEKDIVHFRHIRVRAEYTRELQRKISQVKQGEASDAEMIKRGRQLESGEITREAFDKAALGKGEETFKELTIKKLLGHYYLPVVLGNKKADYIQHIIKVPSEIKFLNALEKWTANNTVPWEAWTFSKLDESLDEVHVPYHDPSRNEYRRFFPDFVFWMCRENEYRVVFVDPKSEALAASYHKIDGCRKLFTDDGEKRLFRYGKWNVSVNLFLYNPDANPLALYEDFWINEPLPLFLQTAAAE